MKTELFLKKIQEQVTRGLETRLISVERSRTIAQAALELSERRPRNLTAGDLATFRSACPETDL